jgi:hypothetical protein
MPTNSGALWRWHQDGLLSNRTVSAVAFNKVRMALQEVTPGVSWLTFVTSLDQSEAGKLKSQLMNHEARSTKHESTRGSSSTTAAKRRRVGTQTAS